MKRAERITLNFLMLTTSCFFFAVVPAPTHAQGQNIATVTVDPPLRSLWAGYLPPRYLRQWDIADPVLSPLSSDRSLLEVSEIPAANWHRYEAFSDRFELLGAIGLPANRASGATRYIYTRATIESEHGHRASLSVGTTSPVRVWLNGIRISDLNSVGTYDLDLKVGANDLIIEYQQNLTPIETSVAIAGADEPWVALDAPRAVLSSDVSNHRVVLTMPAAIKPQTEFIVDRISTALPPKRWTVPQGGDLRLDVSGWPDGPYAFHVRSSLSDNGVKASSRLSWYKGDAAAAAKALAGRPSSGRHDAEDEYAEWLKNRMAEALSADLTAEARTDQLSPILLEYQAAAKKEQTSTGFMRLAYQDPVDGSTQFCRIYLPSDYNQKDEWPTVVSLHGFNPDNPDSAHWWSADATYNPAADRYGVIFIEPHGRGNAQYTGIGENDVLTCLSLARQRLKIDGNRIYLTGESMGGAGTWLIASRHPDLFAAIAPNFGGWDFRVTPSFGFDLSHALGEWPSERYFLETQSSFQSVESLLHVPVFVNHGGSDPAVPVDYSRHAVSMLQQWGYDVRYWEHPGGKHADLDQYDIVIPWLLQHKKQERPAELRIRSRDLAGAAAYWLTVEGSEQPLTMIRVEAKFEMPGLLRIDTSNVASMVLTPPDEFYGPSRRLKIIWNDMQVEAVPDARGRLHLGQPFRTAMVKQAGFEGGLSSVLTTPFMLVIGTQSADATMGRTIVDKAETFAKLWQEWQHTSLRMKRDTEVTPADEAQYSLILLGGPGENMVARAWASQLPFTVGQDRISVGDRNFATRDAVLQLIYPSPAAANRYAFVIAPTSAAGMYFWNAGGLWLRPLGASFIPLDWTIQDGLRVDLPRGMAAERAYVASGVFDEDWHGRGDLVFPGDNTVRSAGRLRSASRPVDVQLADYVGNYEIVPGFSAAIAQVGDGLIMTIPGGAPVTLIAERRDEFGARENNSAYVFLRDWDGQVCGVDIYSGAPKVFAKRTAQCNVEPAAG